MRLLEKVILYAVVIAALLVVAYLLAQLSAEQLQRLFFLSPPPY